MTLSAKYRVFQIEKKYLSKLNCQHIITDIVVVHCVYEVNTTLLPKGYGVVN